MSENAKIYCWACERHIPRTELTPGGRHDEDKGGCGCYIDTVANHRSDGFLTCEQDAFKAGYGLGALNRIFELNIPWEEAYKEWKEVQR